MWKRPDPRLLRHVAGVAPYALVAPGAEGERAFTREDDDANLGVLPRPVEPVGQLDHCLGPEHVAHLGPVDRDLRDPLGGLEADVLVFARGLPIGPARIVLSVFAIAPLR